MYHYVSWLPATDPNMDLRKDLTVSPVDFEAMLKFLKDNGYTTITSRVGTAEAIPIDRVRELLHR